MINKVYPQIFIFFKKIPIIREILAFFDLFWFISFKKTIQYNEALVSRSELFFQWFIDTIYLNGVLWYLILMIMFNWELNFLYPVGIGLLRYMILDSLQQVVSKIKSNNVL